MRREKCSCGRHCASHECGECQEGQMSGPIIRDVKLHPLIIPRMCSSIGLSMKSMSERTSLSSKDR